MERTLTVVDSGVAAAHLVSFRILGIVLIIILAGVLMARLEGGEHQSTLARLNRQIFIPCLVFSALNRIPMHISEALIMASAAAVFSLCSYPLARWWVSGGSDGNREGFAQMMFSSTSTTLLPLAYLLFGSQGVAKAAFFHITNLFLSCMWGNRLAGRPAEPGAFLKAPTLHAVLLALALKFFKVNLPVQIQELLWLVEKGIAMMAAGSLPVLLISHGYALRCLSGAGAGLWSGAAFVRALLIPLVAAAMIIVLRLAGAAPMEKGYDLMKYLDLRTSEAILLLASALPCTISSFWQDDSRNLSLRNRTLILSSSVIAVVATAVILFVINSYLFSL